MTTIGTIVIIIALTALWLWTWRNNVELRRQRAKYRTQRDKAISKTCEVGREIGRLEDERDARLIESGHLKAKNALLKQRLAKFETYKSLLRDERGRFMKRVPTLKSAKFLKVSSFKF